MTPGLISGSTDYQLAQCIHKTNLNVFFFFWINLMYRLIVGTLSHIFAMSAIKWHVPFLDCSLIYADFQGLFVFKTFEFGANFGPRWFSLGFESETIYGKICKKIQWKISFIFWLSWQNNELIWKLLTCIWKVIFEKNKKN